MQKLGLENPIEEVKDKKEEGQGRFGVWDNHGGWLEASDAG